MKVYGPLEYAQLELATPGTIVGTQSGRIYADNTAPAALIPMFHDGTAYRRLLMTTGVITPTQQLFIAPFYYTFTLASPYTCAAGATATNNGQTFIVLYALASSTTLVCSGTGAPTLTASTIHVGVDTLSYTTAVLGGIYYPTSSAVRYLRVRGVSGGGGGAGSGSASGGTGGTGATTSFGTVAVATGGAGATFTVAGAGGVPTVTLPAYGFSLTGGAGMGRLTGPTTANGSAGLVSLGGIPYLGGANNATVLANSGSGGAGGAMANINACFTGPGGGSGAYFDVIIPYPLAASYAFLVGAGGVAGTLGTSGNAGIAGSLGALEVTEHYQ